MSISTNNSKTPSGKSKKGQVSVREDSGSIKACFPRTHFADEKQVKLGTGISLVNGWEAVAAKLQRRLQMELEDGKLGKADGTFNKDRYKEILEEYGLRAKLRLVNSGEIGDGRLPPKPELSLVEIWDRYCDYRKHGLAETTYELMYRGQYLNYINDAIQAVGCDDAIKVRNWLVENRCLKIVRYILSNLSKAYLFAIKQGIYYQQDPFDGMMEGIIKAGKQGYTASDKDDETDSDTLDRGKAYTWEEVETILAYAQQPKKSHWYKFIKFKFLTGVRSGEAIGIWWKDVKWERECLTIQRSYSGGIKKTMDTKNETPRFFPMPKDGELWNLLKSIPQGEPNENIFKAKKGGIIDRKTFHFAWTTTIIQPLISEGKLTKYLPPYNTRHTFITHQIFDIGIDERIVAAWCEHSEVTSKRHYQDTVNRAMQIKPGYGEQTNQSSELDLLKEQLRKQQELIDKLLEDKQ